MHFLKREGAKASSLSIVQHTKSSYIAHMSGLNRKMLCVHITRGLHDQVHCGPVIARLCVTSQTQTRPAAGGGGVIIFCYDNWS